jgi:DNA polymerase-3 subunit alpha
LKDLVLDLDSSHLDLGKKIPQLHKLLSVYQGGSCPVQMKLTLPGASTVINLSDQWQVSPKNTLLAELKKALPEQQRFIRY